MGLNLISGDNQEASGGNDRDQFQGRLPGQCVRIHTLGRFGIQLDGCTLPAERLRQQRPVELLQALIALGGRGINKEVLATSLWPDAEGDEAANSYDVTLHRLRKLLKHDHVLIAADGRLTLNSEIVWVNVWALERMLNHIDRMLVPSLSNATSHQAVQLLTQAITLHQGGFLTLEAFRPWSLSPRERLRSKLIRAIAEVARQAEVNLEWNTAARLYQQGLEMDPLWELFYQRLMVCYRESGRNAMALAVYRRCCTNLSAGLCIAPSPETSKIHASLR